MTPERLSMRIASWFQARLLLLTLVVPLGIAGSWVFGATEGSSGPQVGVNPVSNGGLPARMIRYP